jgi:hypothetical protein
MHRISLIIAISTVAALVSYSSVLLAAEPKPAIAWEADYGKATERATKEHKMLLVVFHDAANPLSQRLETETLNDTQVSEKAKGYVCARLPLDYKLVSGGKDKREEVLLEHASLAEMLKRPGIVVIDHAHAESPGYGCVVSTFPLLDSIFYGPGEMLTILDLPPGTLTQRTLIYAVRTHPERPASANGLPNCHLMEEATGHAEYQAQICVQGHHRWESRFQRIVGRILCGAREVCAESWPGQGLLEGAIECVRCWRCSPGHWGAVRAETCAYGYDMKQGRNGVWYATGIFGCR